MSGNPQVSRRSALKIAALSTVGVVAAPTLAGCAAIPPLAATWLFDMTTALAAAVVVETSKAALTADWTQWELGRRNAYDSEAAGGYGYHSEACFGDLIPPALMFSTHLASKVDSQTDRLIVCVDGGTQLVAFEPWAWQGLYMYVKDLTDGKGGADRAQAQALCKVSLIPAGAIDQKATPSGKSGFLSYATRNGNVELVRWTNEQGQTQVQVTAEGIPGESGRRLAKTYTVPAV